MQTLPRRAFTAQVKKDALKMAVDFHQLSYAQAAERAGVSKSTIGNLMSGKRRTVTPETAAKIAAGFNVSTESIFYLTELRSG